MKIKQNETWWNRDVKRKERNSFAFFIGREDEHSERIQIQNIEWRTLLESSPACQLNKAATDGNCTVLLRLCVRVCVTYLSSGLWTRGRGTYDFKVVK